MNTLWNFIASYLPSIRIINNLEDNYPSDDEESDDGSYELPTTISYPMTLPRRPGQRHDRPLSHGAVLDGHRASDADPLRIKQLETFNNRLQEQVLTLQRQLDHLQADFSSAKMELEHQRSANTVLVSQKGQLSVELAQACASRQAQATEVQKLRTSYAELANSVRTLESNGEELRTLKSFLTKTDDFSGQQIIQAVHDLNTEILQLAAAVSDEFPLTRRSPGLWKESHSELIRGAIGDGMLALLRDGDHGDDPTVVQLAIQAWEVWCCRQVLDSFCAGVPPEIDRFLNDIFREMQSSEPQATTSRWRTLTHMYARSVLPAYTAPAPAYPGSLTSSSLISPISLPPYPTPGSTANNTPDQRLFALPMPRSRTPSSASASSLGDPSSRTACHISGILAILSLAGCNDERGVHREPLRARFGEAISHIAERTEALERIFREGVSSAWFEAVIENPSTVPALVARVSSVIFGLVVKRSTPPPWRTCTQGMEARSAASCAPLHSGCPYLSGERRERLRRTGSPLT
ncbi:hypothetical protein B0F90DRAFT_1323128 [Multifurca ochricompacta]|uniref:Uncharacterized protein n=1 Tax=Multifurca ochricompacta TaxID=376703 RepID=A0AAD4QMF7_9AGAM|nr:hypothetical protein B0F90DRAFT_1323128 [Multifurca ochricompacta]